MPIYGHIGVKRDLSGPLASRNYVGNRARILLDRRHHAHGKYDHPQIRLAFAL